MRRQPRDPGEKSIINGMSTVVVEKQMQKRSNTTGTNEAMSSNTTGKDSAKHNNVEQETVDIQLASGEEDLASEESDSLLAQLQVDVNGTTYL